jgi:vacuolar-type H+-ATPase subunit F/Vma7
LSAAAIGDPTFTAGFRLIGVEGIVAVDEDEALNALKRLLEEPKYKLLILPERFVKATRELRSRLMKEGKVTPIFAFIPDYTGVKGLRVEELKRSISLAVGAELRF